MSSVASEVIREDKNQTTDLTQAVAESLVSTRDKMITEIVDTLGHPDCTPILIFNLDVVQFLKGRILEYMRKRCQDLLADIGEHKCKKIDSTDIVGLVELFWELEKKLCGTETLHEDGISPDNRLFIVNSAKQLRYFHTLLH